MLQWIVRRQTCLNTEAFPPCKGAGNQPWRSEIEPPQFLAPTLRKASIRSKKCKPSITLIYHTKQKSCIRIIIIIRHHENFEPQRMLVHLVQSAFAAQEFAMRLTEKSPTKQEPYTTWTVEEMRQPIGANVEGIVARNEVHPKTVSSQSSADWHFSEEWTCSATGICTQMSWCDQINEYPPPFKGGGWGGGSEWNISV